MRSTKPVHAHLASRRRTGMMTRMLALGGCAGSIVAAWHLLPVPREPGPPTTTVAWAEPDERAIAAQMSPAVSGAGPRVVYPGPPVRSAPPFRGTEATFPGGTAGVRPAEGATPAASLPDVPSPPVVVAAPVTQGGLLPEQPIENRVERVPESAVAGPPPSLRGVDLNTASLAELNALPGAGSIGRAVIRSRPYTSPEDLLTKRVINKATYQRIKDLVRTP